MYKTFWTAIFTSFLMVFLGVNIAFTFDLVNMINPTSVTLPSTDSYSNYYFGFRSFSDAFTSYFGDGGALRGFHEFLLKFGQGIGTVYTRLQSTFALIGQLNKQNPAWELISAIFAILVLANNAIFLLVLGAYLLFLGIYIICFIFVIFTFIIAFFGGAFRTPLPNTYDFDSPLLQNTVYSLRALMV